MAASWSFDAFSDFASPNLRCDCQLKWMVKWIAETNVNIPVTQCAEPPEMRDIFVRNLNRDNLGCGACTSFLSVVIREMFYCCQNNTQSMFDLLVHLR